MNITIKSMAIDSHQVPAPDGLSELVNRAGAWSAEPVPPLDGYRREVKRMDGRLVTVIESEVTNNKTA